MADLNSPYNKKGKNMEYTRSFNKASENKPQEKESEVASSAVNKPAEELPAENISLKSSDSLKTENFEEAQITKPAETVCKEVVIAEIVSEDSAAQKTEATAHISEQTAEANLPEEKQLTFYDKLKDRGFFSIYFITSIAVFIFSAIVYLVSWLSPGFAEFWIRYPGYWIKLVLAKITSVFSFSLAECLLISLPVIIIVYFIASTKAMNKAQTPKDFYKWLLPLVCVLLLIISCFFTAFAPGYFRNTLDKNLGIDKKEVSAKELYDTAVILAEKMSSELDNITFEYGGSSVLPYSYKELTAKVNAAYKKYADSVDYINSFSSKPKPIVLSPYMTYTHISGVYTFMTGEANINTNYPDFVIPFTMAHEMSHQRGIAREDEANFVAYLVCINSDDPYIRYSGYTNVFQYLKNALYSADKDLYYQFAGKYYPLQVQSEYDAFSRFFDKYRDSTSSKVTQTVNDIFLKSQGNKEGTKSYGFVVDLTVAYYNNLRSNPKS